MPTKSVRRTALMVPESDRFSLGRALNVFVVGDLIIDHTAFLHSATSTYPSPVTGEVAFRVKRRLDTAGGAATTARSIDALTDGMTFLWGLVGCSPWGTFRSILEKSQVLDGARSRIDFRGSRDETEAPMTTISRLVSVASGDLGRERYERKTRFADYGQIQIPLSRQLIDLSHHLDQAHRTKAPLDAILLNDLDMGALHYDVVKAVAAFSVKHHIPIIVRARRDGDKYREISVEMMICTMAEWKVLSGDDEDVEYWTNNIQKQEVADDFTRRTLATFREAKRCVVLVGDDWVDSVYIVDRPAMPGENCQLFVMQGLDPSEKGKSQQVGVSDVFAGALAVGLCTRLAKSHEAFSGAVNFAMRFIDVYQRNGWHQIPRPEAMVDSSAKQYQLGSARSSRPFGSHYLPHSRLIDLEEAKTNIPGIYSVSSDIKERLVAIERDAINDDRSLVLVAAGGSGKTEIAKHMIASAKQAGLEACWLTDLSVKWSWANPQKTVSEIVKACALRSDSRPFVVVDEVLKNPGRNQVASKGVVLLNLAKDAGLRLLLIDADFAKLDTDKLRSQFSSRVTWHQLPPSWDHPEDIPYVLASCLRVHSLGRQITFSVEAAALVAIIEWMLETKQSFRNLFMLVKQLSKDWDDLKEVHLAWVQLPPKVRGKYAPRRASVQSFSIKFE